MSYPLCLKLGHGQKIMFLYISTRGKLFSVFLALSREGKVSSTTFTFKSPILDKQKQISFGSSFRARFPHSAQLSSFMEPWGPIGPVSSGCPGEETSSQWLTPRQMAIARSWQRQGWGEDNRSSRPGPRLMEGLSEGSGALQDVVLPAHTLT